MIADARASMAVGFAAADNMPAGAALLPFKGDFRSSISTIRMEPDIPTKVYTGAALQHFTLGHAYIPGGWNLGIFMPVWPFLVGLVFHFTGISVVAARALAVGCVCLSVLLAYSIARQYESKTFACLTAFLIAANALGFFFGRLALLEPAFGMFLLLAIYVPAESAPVATHWRC